jgi:hypothetical protein
LANLDENAIRQSLQFGVEHSTGAIEADANENFILHDSEICDYLDTLLGYVLISELESVRGRLGLPVERDLHFEADFTISVYARAARAAERIVEDRDALEAAAIAQREALRNAEGGAS